MLLKIVLILSTLLCVKASETTKPPTFVEKLNQRNSNSTTFWFLYRLYTVKNNGTHIEISKTDEDYNNSEVQCTATLDPVKDGMTGRIRTVPGVYTMVVYGADNVEIDEKTRKTHYKTLLVNHINCTHGAVTLPVEEVPVDYPVLPPLVDDDVYGFEFFYPNKECSPCLVITEAGFTKPKDQLKIDTEKPSRNMLLKKARWPHNNPYGYFYVYNFANGTAVIKFLSKQYEVIKEDHVDHPIDVADVSYSPTNETTYVAFCYGNGTKEVHCGLYDDARKVRKVFRVNLLDKTYASGMTVKVNKQGHSMISLVQSSAKEIDKAHEVSFFIYDTEGKLIDNAQVTKIESQYRHFDLNSWFYDYGNKQEYCVHVTGRETVDSTDAQEIVQCSFGNEVHKILS